MCMCVSVCMYACDCALLEEPGTRPSSTCKVCAAPPATASRGASSGGASATRNGRCGASSARRTTTTQPSRRPACPSFRDGCAWALASTTCHPGELERGAVRAPWRVTAVRVRVCLRMILGCWSLSPSRVCDQLGACTHTTTAACTAKSAQVGRATAVAGL